MIRYTRPADTGIIQTVAPTKGGPYDGKCSFAFADGIAIDLPGRKRDMLVCHWNVIALHIGHALADPAFRAHVEAELARVKGGGP